MYLTLYDGAGYDKGGGDAMIFRQFLVPEGGCAGYLLG